MLFDIATRCTVGSIHEGGTWPIMTSVRKKEEEKTTKREMQVKINKEVLRNWAQVKEVWDKVPNNVTVTRIDHCQCGFIVWGPYIFLVSYSTMVAYIDPDGVLVDVLRLVHGYI